MKKIIRTVCYFDKDPQESTLHKLDKTAADLESDGYIVQTKRVCSPSIEAIEKLDKKDAAKNYYFSAGTQSYETIVNNLDKFLALNNTAWNLDLSRGQKITRDHLHILEQIIAKNPTKTFSFTYVFNNPPSTPYFPSADYEKDGFALGLQSPDLFDDRDNLQEWLEKMKQVWNSLHDRYKKDPAYLGIDSSIAPLFQGTSSFVHIIKSLNKSFELSATTDFFVTITKWLKQENPKPFGLCGLMLPCLEDFELADEYENGQFSIERNIFLSLHSGLGIDTYPIGTDEDPDRILEVLRLLQALSDKYKKPLSARFVSDGKAKIGERTDFKHQYLKDVIVSKL